MNRIFLFLLLLRLYGQSLSAQTTQATDNLVARLPGASDTAKVSRLIGLTRQLAGTDAPKALRLGREALQGAKALHWATGEVRSLNALAGVYAQTRAYRESLAAAEDALQIATATQRNDCREEIAFNSHLQGRVYFELDDYARSLEKYREALRLYQCLGNATMSGRSLHGLGNVFEQMGAYPEAFDHYLQALRIAEREHDERAAIGLLDCLANNNKLQGNLDQALDYLEKGLSLIKNRKGPADGYVEMVKGYLLDNAADVYLEQKKYGQALHHAFAALRIRDSLRLDKAMVSNLYTIAGIYAKQADHAGAMRYLHKALRISQETGYREGLAFCHNLLAEVHKERREPDLARTHALQGLAQARAIHLPGETSRSCQLLAQIYSQRGDYRLAYHYHQAYTSLKDSLFNQEKSRRIARAQTLYLIEKKEQQITALRQENRIQALENQRKNYWLGGIGLLSVLCVSAGITFFYLYRNHRRANRRLQAQQEEITLKNQVIQQALVEKELLMKEVHHRVKNNLQIVQSLLESQARNTPDGSARYALQDSRNRVLTIALIHQFLHRKDDLSYLDLKPYLETLVHYLVDSLGVPRKVQVRQEVASVRVDVDVAVLLGLILHETVSNALKYAFPDGASGLILIRLQQQGSALELTVADNGAGLPAGFSPRARTSLGMNLVYGLAGQLQAEATFENQGGCTFRLVAPLRRDKKRPGPEKVLHYTSQPI